MHPTPLTDLCLRLLRVRAGRPWVTLIPPAEALDLLSAATDQDLQALRRCLPWSAYCLLRQLEDELGLPEAAVTAVIRRLRVLPPDRTSDPFATPEGVDWAVERYRTLFGRR